MPTVIRSRTVAAPPEELWQVISDPYHLPRWWPRVARVEAVAKRGWTSVLLTERGNEVRVRYDVVSSKRPSTRRWTQAIAGSPFEKILHESSFAASLEPISGGTRMTLEARQRPKGMARLGALLMRRATAKQLDEALEGLERACAR